MRQLFKKLNAERKKQAQKTDVLCNDFVAAHRDFIKTLHALSFAANFYESISGEIELANLLDTAGQAIKEQINNANVVFFLKWQNSFKLHMFENNPISLEKQDLENCFTAELVNHICRANKQCGLEELLEMGMQANPVLLKDVCVFTVPLGQFGSSLGFILIYCPSQNKISTENLSRIVSVVPGLSKAIATCQTLLQIVE